MKGGKRRGDESGRVMSWRGGGGGGGLGDEVGWKVMRVGRLRWEGSCGDQWGKGGLGKMRVDRRGWGEEW